MESWRMPEGVCASVDLNKVKSEGGLIPHVKPIIQLHVTLFSSLHTSLASQSPV